jgi:uncharacterized membrane protein (DUF373 family)
MEFPSRGWRALSRSAFNQVEHGLYVALAALLCATCFLALAGSAVTLVEGMEDWSATDTVFTIIDRLLVVLMLVELLHTVLVSVRSGALIAEPFLVVGLIASIRRILVITLETSQSAQHGGMGQPDEAVFRAAMIELGVLGMLILVMVASIYLLRRARQEGREMQPDRLVTTPASSAP